MKSLLSRWKTWNHQIYGKKQTMCKNGFSLLKGFSIVHRKALTEQQFIFLETQLCTIHSVWNRSDVLSVNLMYHT